MDVVHLKDYSIVTPEFEAHLNLSVLNPRLVKAQKWLGDRILESNQTIMPIRTGSMRQRSYVADDGRKVVFPGPYARFQWGGLVMVDPLTGSPWARRGVKKVLTDRPLKYGDPNATDHWTDAAWAKDGTAIMKGVKKILEGGNGQS